jgi:Xaa-Pro aminopeptidase
MDRIWHPVLVRFGENTLKKFNQRSDGDSRLEDDDIFFIDLGVVWDAHEGDVGATFVVGDDAQMKACAAAVKTVFDDVERHWRETGAGGKALYDYAAQRADALGWRLNLDIKGHRVSDFPHAITRRAISAISTRIRTPAYGYSKYNWRIRRDDSARSMKTCSYKHY